MNLQDKRKNRRYQTIAKARIDGVDYGEVLLKDISITGCCLESTVFVDLKPGIRYRIEIIPENAANIGKFQLVVELVWVHGGGYSTDLGFGILESPKGRLFQRYVDYLAWRSEAAPGANP